MARKKKRDAANTPLGREYARLNSFKNDDPALRAFPARRVVQADELAVWTASVGRTKHPLGPPDTRPNPCFVGRLVLCSTFSPGCVLAYDRDTGERRWRRKLNYYGHHVYWPDGASLAYAGTCQELLALDPETGRVEWAFCPYGRSGETLYSAPSVAAGRLFIGDRRGYLHCLSAATGEPEWRVLTSRAANNDVNSDPVVHRGVVVVGTNAGLALGYDAASGREVWRHRLDGPCTNTVPAGGDRALLWTRATAYLFSCSDGRLLGLWRRRNYAVQCACLAGDLTLMVTQRVWGDDLWPVAELRAYRGETEVYVQQYPRWSGASIRYEPATGQVYEATSQGLGVLDPTTGEREVVITGFGRPDAAPYGQVQQPAVDAKRLYVVDEPGQVRALRHP